MSIRFPTSGLPKGVFYPLRSVLWLAEHREWLLGIGICVLILCIWAGIANAICNTIPERRDRLCILLGYEATPCELQWEKRKNGKPLWLQATITFIADNDVDEPLTGSAEPTTATMMRIKTSKGSVSKIFSVTNPDFYPFEKGPGDPPCITPDCTEQQLIEGLEHMGVDKWALLDVTNFLSRTVMQPPDDRMTAVLQAAHDSPGLPIAVAAYNPRLEGVGQPGLALELKIDVLWGFALPAGDQ
jgi:hypothetical protein